MVGFIFLLERATSTTDSEATGIEAMSTEGMDRIGTEGMGRTGIEAMGMPGSSMSSYSQQQKPIISDSIVNEN